MQLVLALPPIAVQKKYGTFVMVVPVVVPYTLCNLIPQNDNTPGEK